MLASVEDDRIYVGLYYGADAQWVRNVLAGGATVVRAGRTRRLERPRIVRDALTERLPATARVVVRHVPVLVADLA